MLLVWGLVGAALLVIVPAVGVMVYVATANVTQRGPSAREAATIASMATVASAIKLYELDTGAPPVTLNALAPKYLEFAPVDAWNQPFVYTLTPGGSQPFMLYSTGESGKDRIDYQGRK